MNCLFEESDYYDFKKCGLELYAFLDSGGLLYNSPDVFKDDEELKIVKDYFLKKGTIRDNDGFLEIDYSVIDQEDGFVFEKIKYIIDKIYGQNVENLHEPELQYSLN